MTSKGPTKYFFWGFLILLSACTVWSYAGTLISSSNVASKAYQQAFEAIKQDMGPQDMVLIHPPWREDVVKILTDLPHSQWNVRTTLPTGHWAMGKIVLLKDRNGPPLSRRILNMNRTSKTGISSEIDIQFLQIAHLDEHVDFMKLLPTASVEVQSDKGKVTKCKWQNKTRRHICPGLPNWIYVGPHEMSSGNKTKTCIWSHPAKNGTLSISFPNPPIQKILEFEHALSSNAVRSQNKSPVTVDIYLDQNVLKKLSRNNRVGFQASKILTPLTTVKILELKIRAKKDGARHYCFNLRTKNAEAQP